MDIEKIDNELLNHLQSNFPLVEEPFLERSEEHTSELQSHS